MVCHMCIFEVEAICLGMGKHAFDTPSLFIKAASHFGIDICEKEKRVVIVLLSNERQIGVAFHPGKGDVSEEPDLSAFLDPRVKGVDFGLSRPIVIGDDQVPFDPDDEGDVVTA